MSQTWIFSDSHFGHKNIVTLCGRPADHEVLMWNNLLSSVGPEDTLIHLGDVGFGPRHHLQTMVDRLPGRIKILIEGNHDKRSKIRKCTGWTQVVRPVDIFRLEHEGVRFAMTHKPQNLPNVEPGSADALVHGHIHNVGVPYRWKDNILIVNACVEQWKYEPIPLTKIIEIYRAKSQTFLVSNENSS